MQKGFITPLGESETPGSLSQKHSGSATGPPWEVHASLGYPSMKINDISAKMTQVKGRLNQNQVAKGLNVLL